MTRKKCQQCVSYQKRIWKLQEEVKQLRGELTRHEMASKPAPFWASDTTSPMKKQFWEKDPPFKDPMENERGHYEDRMF